jgi:hypothetical protein
LNVDSNNRSGTNFNAGSESMMRRLMTMIGILALAAALQSPAHAQDTTLGYQGQLQQAGEPLSGTANLQFQLYDALVDGSQIGTTVIETNWPVENGLFQIELDFGPGAFDGSERFLEVWVNGAPLNPRQKVTATPFALLAAGTMSGAIGDGEVDPSQVQLRVTGNCPTGQYIREIDQSGSVLCGVDGVGDPAWTLSGNSGTDPATNFLGTIDDQALEFRTNNVRSLRIEPSDVLFEGLPITANVIAGSRANEVTEGMRGATIGGGGVPSGDSDPDFFDAAPHRITQHYGTISGGYGNRAGNDSGEFVAYDGIFATVGGGDRNTASGGSATVGGGAKNTASGEYSTVGGGLDNCAGGNHSWAGGRRAKVRPGDVMLVLGHGCEGVPLLPDAFGDRGTFIWSDSENADFVSTGPDQFLVRAAGGVGINTNAPATHLHLGGLNTDADTPDGLRLENTLGRRWDIHSSNQWLRFNYDSGNGSSNNVAYVSNVDGSWNQLSDRRLKRDIRPIATVLNRVAALDVVDFRFNHDTSGESRQLGLIAQDVAEHFPELASREEEGGYLGVNYAGFSVVALKAIQEQQALIGAQHTRIDVLETEVSTLTSHADRIEALSERNAALEARLAVLETLLYEDTSRP